MSLTLEWFESTTVVILALGVISCEIMRYYRLSLIWWGRRRSIMLNIYILISLIDIIILLVLLLLLLCINPWLILLLLSCKILFP